MDMAFVLSGVEQYGYGALFFLLWLGIVGMPIPDEVVVMSGGFVTTLGILEPLPSFLLCYAGVVTGLSIGYVIGRTIGAPALQTLMRKKKMGKYVEKGNALLQRYGSRALIFSYFFPVVRHVVPYLVGINKMSFARYALYSYTTGFVWTLLLFLMGRMFGQYIEQIGEIVRQYGWLSVLLFVGITGIIVMVGKTRKSNNPGKYTQKANRN